MIQKNQKLQLGHQFLLPNELSNNEELYNNSDELEEIDDLEVDDNNIINIKSNLLYEVYEKISNVIREDFKNNLKNLLLKKKIKIMMDLEELFDSDEEDS